MSTSSCVRCCAVGVVLVSLGGLSETGWAQARKKAAIERGQELFERVWEPALDADSNADGLGPLFNERSCVACHFLGGIGGASPVSNNVELLTAAIPDSPNKLARLQSRLVALHPAFATSSSIVLHRFSTDPVPYTDFRANLLCLVPRTDREPVRNAAAVRAIMRKQGSGPIKTIEANGAVLLLSTRNTTALFGAGLINSISQSDIEDVAKQQTRENPNIMGRFVGRFGWRGQTIDLGDFVRAACANELGLQVSTHAQAVVPHPVPADQNALVAHQGFRDILDLTDSQCDDLTAFVAALPAPRRVLPTDQQQAIYVKNGEDLFATVGCAACHRARLGNVKGIYSDLLVHDMGSNLFDPAPASSQLSPKVVQRGFGGWGGFAPPVVQPLTPADLVQRREWKTPPLWGLRDSGPYLHDGRAETVEQAIAYHGGEAASSVDRYMALPSPMRARVLAFLSTLAAPEPAKLPTRREPANRPAPAKTRRGAPLALDGAS